MLIPGGIKRLNEFSVSLLYTADEDGCVSADRGRSSATIGSANVRFHDRDQGKL